MALAKIIVIIMKTYTVRQIHRETVKMTLAKEWERQMNEVMAMMHHRDTG